MTEEELIGVLRERAWVQLRQLRDEDFRRAEEALEVPLPPLLRRAVQDVENGGWGPGDGLPLIEPQGGILSMASQELAESGVAWTTAGRADGWPGHLLFLADWGCNVQSILDLRPGRVGMFDFSFLDRVNDLSSASELILWQTASLQEWLERWLAGEELLV